MGIDLPVEPVHEPVATFEQEAGPFTVAPPSVLTVTPPPRSTACRAGQLVKAHPPARCAAPAGPSASEGVQVAATMVGLHRHNRPASPPGRASAPGPGLGGLMRP